MPPGVLTGHARVADRKLQLDHTDCHGADFRVSAQVVLQARIRCGQEQAQVAQ